MNRIILLLLLWPVLASAQTLRMVDGKAYDASQWPYFGPNNGALIKVVEDYGTNGVICECSQASYKIGFTGRREYFEMEGEKFLVQNYPNPDQLVTGAIISSTRALKTGRVQTSYGTLPVYDCGTAYVPPPPTPLTPEQIAAAQARIAAGSAVAKKRMAEANERVLKSNQEAADKGDAYGLLRMGERYRDGDGVEKDLAKARDYLRRAALSGSDTAQRELDQLPK